MTQLLNKVYTVRTSNDLPPYRQNLPQSDREYMFMGLNLIHLLSQNRITEFHTLLELLDPAAIASSPFIRHPIELEQCLMEGSYNKVWDARSKVPAPEYLFFVDILMETIR